MAVKSDKQVLLNGKGNATINLDGGTLLTKEIKRNDTKGNMAINFNGGTLKANGTNNGTLIYSSGTQVAAHVNANGGVIDCSGNPVTLSMPYGFDGAGSLTFTGGNVITLNCNNNNNVYGGITYIASNTTVKASNDRAGKMLAKGIALVGALELGTPYTILASTADSDDWSSLDRSKVTCPAASAFTADIGSDNKSITVTVTAFKPGHWTGKAGDNNLSTPGNWSDNNVPTTGNAAIFSAGSVTLTKGASFAATSITFAEGCSPVTINGDFTTLTCVTNNSSVNQTFAGFVDFGAGDIDVTAPNATLSGSVPNQTVTGGCVVFAGGVKGAKVANHSIVSGNYTLTSDDKFTNGDSSAFTVNENSSLSVKNADSTKNINIREGATFNVGTFSRGISGTGMGNRLWNWNKGTYVITNFTFTGYQGFWLGGGVNSPDSATANANAVLKIGTLTKNHKNSGWLALHGHDDGSNAGTTLTMYIGEGGVNIVPNTAGYYVVEKSVHRTTMRPWNSNFTFGRGSNVDYDFLLGKDKSYGNINFTLNTDDEAGVPRTITMDARICTTNNTSSITVAGHGTNVITSASPLMTGTYAITDAATVKFDDTKKFNNEAAGFANGTISLDDGTTLEYTNDGNTLALPCKTLVLPESGTATLRINGDKLKGGDHILVAGVSADAASHLDVELADSVKDGRRYEVAVKDGNLVLSINQGIMLIVF